MKKVIALSAFIMVVLGTQAQEFNVPKDYQLVKAEDYAPYEQDVVNGINWLLETPVDEQLSKRKEVNAFILKWISGSPTVHIEIHPEIVNFANSSPDLLMTFLSGWTKYSIETKDYDNKLAGNLAGLQATIDFYQKNKLPKDKNIEDFIKLQKKDRLKSFIERRIQSTTR